MVFRVESAARWILRPAKRNEFGRADEFAANACPRAHAEPRRPPASKPGRRKGRRMSPHMLKAINAVWTRRQDPVPAPVRSAWARPPPPARVDDCESCWKARARCTPVLVAMYHKKSKDECIDMHFGGDQSKLRGAHEAQVEAAAPLALRAALAVRTACRTPHRHARDCCRRCGRDGRSGLEGRERLRGEGECPCGQGKAEVEVEQAEAQDEVTRGPETAKGGLSAHRGPAEEVEGGRPPPPAAAQLRWPHRFWFHCRRNKKAGTGGLCMAGAAQVGEWVLVGVCGHEGPAPRRFWSGRSGGWSHPSNCFF